MMGPGVHLADLKGFHIKAALLKPGQPWRETLVVYGFADKRDCEVMKPGAGGESPDGPDYAAALRPPSPRADRERIVATCLTVGSRGHHVPLHTPTLANRFV